MSLESKARRPQVEEVLAKKKQGKEVWRRNLLDIRFVSLSE